MMNSDENIEKLELIKNYAETLGIRMDMDWSGDEEDEEFVGAYFSTEVSRSKGE